MLRRILRGRLLEWPSSAWDGERGLGLPWDPSRPALAALVATGHSHGHGPLSCLSVQPTPQVYSQVARRDQGATPASSSSQSGGTSLRPRLSVHTVSRKPGAGVSPVALGVSLSSQVGCAPRETSHTVSKEWVGIRPGQAGGLGPRTAGPRPAPRTQDAPGPALPLPGRSLPLGLPTHLTPGLPACLGPQAFV